MKTKRFNKFSVSLVAVVAVLALVLSGCGADTAQEYNKYLKDDKPAVTVDKDKDNSADKADKDSATETDKKDDKASSTDKSDDKSNKKSSTSSSKSDSKSKSSSSSNSSSSSSSKPSTGNSGSSSSSKPSTGSGSSSGSSSKPSTGSGSSSGNSGNSGSTKPSEPEKPAHQHSYNTVVSSTNGDCSHKGKVTKKCSCGATITVDGNYGSHNWKDSYKEVYHEAVTKPVYAYCYVCNGCGAQFKDENDMLYHDATACGSGYSYKEWVDHEEVVTPAWTESVYNGKDCTICGQHSN